MKMTEWNKYVIDGTIATPSGLLCFCPVELDEDGNISSIVTGVNFLSDEPPHGAEVIAVFHADGQEAADAFYADRKEEIDKARARGD